MTGPKRWAESLLQTRRERRAARWPPNRHQARRASHPAVIQETMSTRAMRCYQPNVLRRRPAEFVNEPVTLAQCDASRVALVHDRINACVAWRDARLDISHGRSHHYIARTLAVGEPLTLPSVRDSNDVQFRCGKHLRFAESEEHTLMRCQAYEFARAALEHQKKSRVVVLAPGAAAQSISRVWISRSTSAVHGRVGSAHSNPPSRPRSPSLAARTRHSARVIVQSRPELELSAGPVVREGSLRRLD